MSRDQDPLRVPVSNERVSAAYDRLAAVYARTIAPIEAPSQRRALSILAPQPGERVLSVGCGPGLTLPALVARVGRRGAVDALDTAPRMLAAARRHCRRQGVAERVAFVRGDARRLPYADGTFDAVFASDVLELFGRDDLDAVCAELARVLGPDGRLCAVTMDVEAVPDSRFLRAYEWAFRHVPGFSLVGCRPIDTARALTGAGFEIAERTLETRAAVWPVTVVLARPD